MRTFTSPAELLAAQGETLGTSDWVQVTQEQVNTFADATGDHQWIHVDVEKAAGGPFGQTIAHGFLTLSLIPRLSHEIVAIRKRSRALNYGLNKVRFTAPVPVGSRIRLTQALKASEKVDGGRRLIYEATIEIEGATRPALVAETITLVFD